MTMIMMLTMTMMMLKLGVLLLKLELLLLLVKLLMSMMATMMKKKKKMVVVLVVVQEVVLLLVACRHLRKCLRLGFSSGLEGEPGSEESAATLSSRESAAADLCLQGLVEALSPSQSVPSALTP